MNVEVARNIEI